MLGHNNHVPPQFDPNSYINKAHQGNVTLVKTIAVLYKENGHPMIIAATDFNPDIHEHAAPEAEAQAVVTDKPKRAKLAPPTPG